MIKKNSRISNFAFIGMLGLFTFFSPPDPPEKAVQNFVNLFKAGDSAGIYNLLHPDMVSGKDVKVEDVDELLKRYKSGELKLEKHGVDKIIKSEDDSTERFQVTLVYRGPAFAPKYVEQSKLELVLLWVAENKKWWLERFVSTNFTVNSTEKFPTADQEETAMRFEAALSVLNKLGPATQDLGSLCGPVSAGSGFAEYQSLEQIYTREKNPKGIEARADGVPVLLKGAAHSTGGLLKVYHGDFRNGPDDQRRPVPWEMFRDYVQAAVKKAKMLERQENTKAAENIYRKIVCLGRQFLEESGGFQFLMWGSSFQKQGAEELSRLLSGPEKQKAALLANLSSRRLDSLQTVLNCLDDMSDYKSLKAAIAASSGQDPSFKPWGINTLAILAYKGAPADKKVLASAGNMVIVTNQDMQKRAADALEAAAEESSGKFKSFVEYQKQWVLNNKVYGSL